MSSSIQQNNKPSALEKRLEEKLSSIQLQTEEEAAQKLAEELSLPYLNLLTFPIDISALHLVDEDEARKTGLAVIYSKGSDLKIALLDSRKEETQSLLQDLAGKGYKYDLNIVSRHSIDLAWKRYGPKKKKEGGSLGLIDLRESRIADTIEKVADFSSLKESIGSLPVTEVLDFVTAGALKLGASDIHIEPEETIVRLRYRLDGILNDITGLPVASYSGILSRIKLLSGLKINIHAAPQDGRFTIKKRAEDIEVRVSVLPGAYGESIVMRILDPSTIQKKLEDLGMRKDILENIKRLLAKTTGAILTTGPTGSGKTTTLYAFLRHINSPEIKIITIEDPIEYHLEGVSQTQVNSAEDYTFANGLRSIVRQDPDIILVGEIRDAETAEIAMQAALTGHLVFSTLHTNNSAGAIPRLINFGLKPVTIAPAINATMAQRLVRKLCQSCKEKKVADSESKALLNKWLSDLEGRGLFVKTNEEVSIYGPGKCGDCNFTGYKGLVGLFEIFEINEEMEDLILRSPTISEIEKVAIKNGMVTLLQDGLIKVLEGTTSLDEVLRVVGQ